MHDSLLYRHLQWIEDELHRQQLLVHSILDGLNALLTSPGDAAALALAAARQKQQTDALKAALAAAPTSPDQP